MMPLFDCIAIIGPGLIGGSFALGAKKKGLSGKVIGISRSKKTILRAKRMRVIDKGSLDINSIRDADLVVFATPVSTTLKLAPLVAKIIKRDCLVIDVGSTKQEVVTRLDRIFDNYLGTHPLAGSEKKGVLYADAEIFCGALCIFTPTPRTKPAVLAKVKKTWQRLGSKVIFLTPREHDRVISLVSHLPHALAFCLMDTVPVRYLSFAAGGLRDTTRIAASDSELWKDIFLTNRKNILSALELMRKRLEYFRRIISTKNQKALVDFLNKAQSRRKLM